MCIYRIRLEVIREGPHEQSVYHTALIDVQIVLNLAIPPICEVSRIVIGCIKSVSSYKGNSIRQNGSGNGVIGSYSHTGLLRVSAKCSGEMSYDS